MKVAVFEKALGDFQHELSDFDPALISSGDAARAFAVFTDLEKTISAARTLVTARATDAGDWKAEGHRSPASWVAEKTGTGFGEASGMLESSERLVGLPETTEALRRGGLSGAQLKEITATAAQNPQAEKELLEAAKMDARLAPDDFARFCGAIRTEANAVFGEARKSGRRESTAAYEADALVALVTETNVSSTASSTRGRPTTVHLRVDLAALRRGELEEGESCEIPGVGPVPLATATNVLGESILKVIIGDGVDVTSVCHLGRAVPAHIRSALVDRDEKCVVPGCDVAKGLEIDHYQIAFENDGPTELWNLCRLCRWHHHLKTHCDYAISGEPGSWEWTAPASDRSPVLTS